MKRKKSEGKVFFITLSCCIMVIAIVGFANRIAVKDKAEEMEIARDVEESLPEQVSVPELPKQEEKTELPQAVSEPVNKSVQIEEKITFNSPVKGKVIEEYSGDELVYNEALKDWRAHSGVDFEAEQNEQVLCSANGVVEDVFDSNMGRCVVVDHGDGFKTMYANLNEDTSLKPGDEVAQGDVVGTVGGTALGDSTDEPHLHFEILSNNKNVNPIEYLD